MRTATASPSSIADIALELLDGLPPADRANILRQQIDLVEAAIRAKRNRLAEIGIAAVVLAAKDLGIDLLPGVGLAASQSELDDAWQLEAELSEMDFNLPILRGALAAIEVGSAHAIWPPPPSR